MPLESLSSMQCFLNSRPKQFSTPQQAIEYMVRSGQVRNVESARVSIIGQIQPMVTTTTTQSNVTDSSTLPSVSHLCDTVQEEEETEENEQKSSIDIQQPTTTDVSNDTNKYTWRIDLSKTEQFWQGWFSGL